jgi:hypothetical protein
MTADDLNPVVEICGLRLPLTQFCHSAGLDACTRARSAGKDSEAQSEAYLAAYYARLRKVAPWHPALAECAP